MNFVKALSEKSLENWKKLCEKAGTEWKPDVDNSQGVSCEVNIEPLEEIKEIMESNRGVWRE